MTELERAQGDCGNCEIAANFAAGSFEQSDLADCESCQKNNLPRNKRLLREINAIAAEARRQEQATTRVFSERIENAHLT